MQRLSYPTETVLDNNITRNRIVISFKDSPRKPLGRRPSEGGGKRSGQPENVRWRKWAGRTNWLATTNDRHRVGGQIGWDSRKCNYSAGCWVELLLKHEHISQTVQWNQQLFGANSFWTTLCVVGARARSQWNLRPFSLATENLGVIPPAGLQNSRVFLLPLMDWSTKDGGNGECN